MGEFKKALDTTINSAKAFTKEPIFPGFEPNLRGELVFCDHDNLNTDGIYPGKYTYQDDLTPKQMADVVMENYDPKFASSIQTV